MIAVGSGLLLDVVTAALFGAGAETDAFFAAARLPFALTAVLMVLSTQILVPSFATWFVDFAGPRAKRLATTVLLTGTVTGLLVAGILALVADPLLTLIAPGFSTAQHELAVELSRVMVLMIPLTAGSEVLRAWLNARHSYLIPAGMTLILNLTAVGVILVSGGGDVRWISVAYVVGATVQFGLMLAFAAGRGFRPARPAVRDPEMARLGRMAVRPTLGAGLNPVVRIAETFAASFLPDGSVTIVHYGNRLVSAVGGTVLFRSVMVATLPRLTRAFAEGRQAAASSVTRLSIRVMAAISLPLTGLGLVLAVPLTVAVFSRGEFAGDDARILGLTLSVYALSFAGSGLQRALLAPFYAVRNTRVPLANTIWGVVANLLLLPLFVLPIVGQDLGVSEELGVLGIAAAYSVAQYANVWHAVHRLRRANLVDLSGLARPLTRSAVAAVAGALAAGGVVLLVSQSGEEWLTSDLVTLFGSLAALAAGLLITLAVESTDPELRRAVRHFRVRRKGGRSPQQPAASDGNAEDSPAVPRAE